ncbi:protein ALP1-like [Salvia miltiorrhiza]|uniref:protein ALP1-like n=1 Tax=Salvia miltiorrhiza TaxID=226208 RepID=UPI0025ABF0FD|nr:protein ALP1-like [Salvia miltiorrhiza]XP_057774302.1 protein ALP1-like [Salvia miltiorrhiza]XP_057774303.1 protein ALP1-like [Salvia miltiorrhiza]XP_057774304.1 protein ALP1-like [Salvia miltiorrhiza]XP_057774305.1 protein ALP1-like [Salvia miltiorrhiza]XP_057774306.1 protein ALP1-like [Salvia miltiorrhiza]XP_057774307.1 protein ALP1-like [Salvia miltiorrhiza]XP_057774308.1 protein ALP1-like [Salvia miltiorrhiza]XP_057774309.1 protein ALP1-like [Salvia miltiorrhiza]XP_057774310.1 prote
MPGGERARLNDIWFLLLQLIMRLHILKMAFVIIYFSESRSRKRKRANGVLKYEIVSRVPDQIKHLRRMIGTNDIDCIVNLRMDRNTFGRLCHILRELGGLVEGRYVSVEEQVAMFLSVLAHHKKNRVVRFDFWRSGQTISHYVHAVLGAILKLHQFFLSKPKVVPDDCTDPRWQWFKGCLGALDGTYINVTVSNNVKPRYRTRKWQISTNVLGVCDRDMKFVYILSGWEGSAADSRILRDALNRPHGFKVPKGNYYLCDNGYANSDGFLTPYKGVRYHLKEWGPTAARPQNKEELFNLRHSKARNVIERAFGLMKMRWGILRSTTFYPIKIQNRLIMATFLINNFIRTEMPNDPLEAQFDEMANTNATNFQVEPEEFIDTVENSPQWNASRDALANEMWMRYVNEH